MLKTVNKKLGGLALVDTPSGFKPAVEDFLNALEDTFSLLGRNGDVVDLVSVEIRDTLDTG